MSIYNLKTIKQQLLAYCCHEVQRVFLSFPMKVILSRTCVEPIFNLFISVLLELIVLGTINSTNHEYKTSKEEI